MTAVNADGVADSLNVSCQLQGIVYGVNLRPPDCSSPLSRSNDGIGVFGGSETFGYAVRKEEMKSQASVNRTSSISTDPDPAFPAGTDQQW